MNFKQFLLKILHATLFDDIIQIEGFDFNNILLDKKSYKNILIYDVTYKTLIGIKVKVDGFNRVYDGTRYLVFSIIWS